MLLLSCSAGGPSTKMAGLPYEGGGGGGIMPLFACFEIDGRDDSSCGETEVVSKLESRLLVDAPSSFGLCVPDRPKRPIRCERVSVRPLVDRLDPFAVSKLLVLAMPCRHERTRSWEIEVEVLPWRVRFPLLLVMDECRRR